MTENSFNFNFANSRNAQVKQCKTESTNGVPFSNRSNNTNNK